MSDSMKEYLTEHGARCDAELQAKVIPTRAGSVAPIVGLGNDIFAFQEEQQKRRLEAAERAVATASALIDARKVNG